MIGIAFRSRSRLEFPARLCIMGADKSICTFRNSL